MYEYQISASKDGRFIFRSDWDYDKERVQRFYNMLLLDIGVSGVIVSVYKRKALMECCTAEFFSL